MTNLDSEEKLIQSIVDKNGDCYHINCDGGDSAVLKIGKVVFQEKKEFSNLGVPCPLRKDCKSFDSDTNELFLKEAKKWIRAFKRKKKKENKNED